jgi:hypothetical protein
MIELWGTPRTACASEYRSSRIHRLDAQAVLPVANERRGRDQQCPHLPGVRRSGRGAAGTRYGCKTRRAYERGVPPLLMGMAAKRRTADSPRNPLDGVGDGRQLWLEDADSAG